jgi:hypothetical protein
VAVELDNENFDRELEVEPIQEQDPDSMSVKIEES